MATTWIKPIHKAKGRTVAATLAGSIGYADNPDKTNGYEFVKSYGCDYYTAANEFALAKQLYEQQTGRGGRAGDILAYHVRQSFKPGEITPEAALEVGYALMEKFTHGRHQFVVAVHTDKEHIHCHCIFSAVNMDCTGKFRNPIRSMKIVRQISDFLCAERGLSIVENPKPSRGSYRDWHDNQEPQSNRDQLRDLIDNSISAGMVFEQFIAAMHSAGCEVKRGKYLSFKLPGAERFIRVKSLGDDYTEEALRERCLGKRTVVPKAKTDATFIPFVITSQTKFGLLIDIQQKIQEGKGMAYANWAKIYNLKQAARTLIYLKENGIDSYDELAEKASSASDDFGVKLKRIKEIEARQKEISELQKNIGTYGKTRDIYKKYLASGRDQGFYEIHRSDIALHEAAKRYFDSHGMKKTPSINTLRQEWAMLESEKKTLYKGYHELKGERKELLTAKDNVERLLGINRDAPERIADREQKRSNSHAL